MNAISVRSLAFAAAVAVAVVGDGSGAVMAQGACITAIPAGSLSGGGDAVSDPIAVPAGLLRFDASFQGTGNFVIWAYDTYGNRELIVNEIGAYDGQKLLQLDQETTILLEVTANGPWSIDLTSM